MNSTSAWPASVFRSFCTTLAMREGLEPAIGVSSSIRKALSWGGTWPHGIVGGRKKGWVTVVAHPFACVALAEGQEDSA